MSLAGSYKTPYNNSKLQQFRVSGSEEILTYQRGENSTLGKVAVRGFSSRDTEIYL